jgi:hypothetical protein
MGIVNCQLFAGCLPAPKVHIANLRRQSVSAGKFANHFGFADR